MKFADQLKSERKRLGLTQAGADAVLDTCRGQIAAWESGRNKPHVLTQEAALTRLRNRKTPALSPDTPARAVRVDGGFVSPAAYGS